ncbi:prepilin-type N-terminal cleavage/methylation domain-containing protein [Fredinandcohnia onubensis]|uniref:prepilin-type N-terminal cleavage/methylation domain-containing protein n=1 Tax=Fredinandcohnia onubensis TaxID=1571209 RepID=UPI0015D493C9|nr:prepilin-type N-terminal cleavage/methylation domain-containing protein [Fredinandcohnia onubensis]
MQKLDNQGFTLIELLASIVIITIILTVFMRFFSQAALFANVNEESLTSSNDARTVLTLIQENDRKNYILRDTLNTLKQPANINLTVPITDETIISMLLFPWKDSTSLTIEDKELIKNTELNLKNGPDNLIEVEVNIKSSVDSAKIISTTYGFLTNRYQYNLKDIPITTDTGTFHLRTHDSPEDIFSQPSNTAIAIKMKNLVRPVGYLASQTEGDLAFMGINNDTDEFSINATVEFSSQHLDGGFGILVDGVLQQPIQQFKANENGYMLVFKPGNNQRLGSVDLYLRENGLNKYGLSSPIETIPLTSNMFEIGNAISLLTKFDVEITVENLDGNSSTRRKYTVVLKQGDTIITKPLVFGKDTLHYIDLNNISNYTASSKFIGIRLWSNSTDETKLNTLSIYR